MPPGQSRAMQYSGAGQCDKEGQGKETRRGVSTQWVRVMEQTGQCNTVRQGNVMRQGRAGQCSKVGQGNEAGQGDTQSEKTICHHGVV